MSGQGSWSPADCWGDGSHPPLTPMAGQLRQDHAARVLQKYARGRWARDKLRPKPVVVVEAAPTASYYRHHALLLGFENRSLSRS